MDTYPQSPICGEGAHLWKAQEIYIELQREEPDNQPSFAVITN